MRIRGMWVYCLTDKARGVILPGKDFAYFCKEINMGPMKIPRTFTSMSERSEFAQ